MSPPGPNPYTHLKGALSASDLATLKHECRRQLSNEHMPCYVFLNKLQTPAYLKLKSCVEDQLAQPVFYLNDFYIYTDSLCKTHWHIDTELFAFGHAVNAWVLLSPDVVDDPLGFIADINSTPDGTFHAITAKNEHYVFGNYNNGHARPLLRSTVEAAQIHTPRIRAGDILLMDPRRFHRTNTATPKHAISFKFVLKGSTGFLSANQVNPCFWPEVSIFNRLMKNTRDWDDFIDRLRLSLSTQAGRKELSAGFYPERFDLYERMAALLSDN